MKHKINSIVFLLIVLLIFVFQLNFWWICVAFLVFALVLIYGVFQIRFNYFLNSFNKNSENKEKIVALTFDDGPTEFTPKFLELLQKHNAKATLFCIGKQIEKHPEIFRKTIENGHEIGNHTYSHSNNTGFLSTKKMLEEIEECDHSIQNIGQISTHLYRPPFGVTNPNIAKAMKKLGKISIGWSVRSYDTMIEDPERIYRGIVSQLKPGTIILLHDTSEKTFLVLKKLLVFLQRESYNTVTISEMRNLSS